MLVKKRPTKLLSSTTEMFLCMASLGVGAYHGYCDVKGIPLKKENLEFTLTYGPAIVQGGLYAIIEGIAGLISGGAVAATSCRMNNSLVEKIIKTTGGAIIGTIEGACFGGAVGGIKGGSRTMVGYGVGYLVGYAIK